MARMQNAVVSRGKRVAGARAGGKPRTSASGEPWILRLYVAGQSPKSLAALANLNRICEQHLQGRYAIEVVDLMKDPQLARGDQVIAIPTLVRKLPPPIKRVIGDLSNAERTLVGMDLVTHPMGNLGGVVQ